MDLTNDEYRGYVSRGLVAPAISQMMDFIEGDSKHMLTHEEVVQRISDYFCSCTEIIVNEENGESTQIWNRSPTKSGFCNCLGISLRCLENYLNDDYVSDFRGKKQSRISREDIPLIRRSMQVISEFYEGRVLSFPAGAIFWLKNSQGGTWLDDQRLKIVDEQKGIAENNRPLLSASEIAAKYSGAVLPEKPDFD